MDRDLRADGEFGRVARLPGGRLPRGDPSFSAFVVPVAPVRAPHPRSRPSLCENRWLIRTNRAILARDGLERPLPPPEPPPTPGLRWEGS
jgi:hypothetical protein